MKPVSAPIPLTGPNPYDRVKSYPHAKVFETGKPPGS